MTTTDINIFNAAFPCDINAPYDGHERYSNPYYWRGRPDFEFKAGSIGSDQQLGLTPSDNNNEDLTFSSLPLPEIGTSPSGTLLDGNQLASLPPNDGGINFQGNSLPSSLDFAPFQLDSDIFNIDGGGASGTEQKKENLNLFASMEGGGAGGSSSTDMFSIADSSTSGSGLGNDFSLASNNDFGISMFSKRRLTRARAKARAL